MPATQPPQPHPNQYGGGNPLFANPAQHQQQFMQQQPQPPSGPPQSGPANPYGPPGSNMQPPANMQQPAAPPLQNGPPYSAPQQSFPPNMSSGDQPSIGKPMAANNPPPQQQQYTPHQAPMSSAPVPNSFSQFAPPNAAAPPQNGMSNSQTQFQKPPVSSNGNFNQYGPPPTSSSSQPISATTPSATQQQFQPGSSNSFPPASQNGQQFSQSGPTVSAPQNGQQNFAPPPSAAVGQQQSKSNQQQQLNQQFGSMSLSGPQQSQNGPPPQSYGQPQALSSQPPVQQPQGMPPNQYGGQQMPGQLPPMPGAPPQGTRQPPYGQTPASASRPYQPPGQPSGPQYQNQMPGQTPNSYYPGQQQQQQFNRQPGPGMSSQPGGMPPQPGMMPGQQGMMPGQQGMMHGQPGMMHSQPGAGHPNPNYPAGGPNAGAPSYMGSPPQQQQKRLDPDQMPSAIGVMQEDQQTRSGIFQTSLKGQLPPLVTTKFTVEDMGNASPRYVRSTMYSVPAQPDMLKQTAIPFALVVNPFAEVEENEHEPYCVDMGPAGPVRCIRCKAYMSPLMQFIDGGRRFQCTLCKATTEVPPEYFQHLDHTGQRIDKWERPELWKGSYELVATVEYCRNGVMPKEPAFIFVIDVSYNNVKSGLVDLLCANVRSLLELLPAETPVGFVTYNSKVHFYNIDPDLGQPQMVIVPDVADMFMPILKGFLVPREKAMSSVDALMEKIPALFANTKETEAVIGPAIQAGMEALKASERVGKLLLFHSSLPASESIPGKLKNREGDRKLLGTDKEKSVLTPQTTYYNNLGQDCVTNGVSVDVFLFNNSYIDVASIGQVARMTGGSVYKFTYFQADIDGTRVIGELKYHLNRDVGFDVVMRVRTSTGVRPTDFHGHFFMSNTTDVEIAAVDSRKAIAVEIKHDDKLTDEDGVYIQIALLYTSMKGQRLLRIHNLALNTCTQMADLYRSCELDTIINFLAKNAISKVVESTPQSIKENVMSRCAQMLATYRKHCANPSMPGQLILPECLKLLPLFVNCVLKCDAVSGNSELTPDDRSWLMYSVMTMSVRSSVHYFYPKLVPVAGPIADLDNPVPLRCSHEKLRDDSAYVLDNGIYIFLWVGSAISPDWLKDVFGVSNLAQINVETITELPDHVNSDESLRLRAFIRALRGERERHMRLTIVRQKEKMELVMNRFLVEDRGSDGQPSYVDFLCHMHKEIRSLLNQ